MDPGSDANTGPDFPIVVIGSGFAGLCMAIRLKQAGFDSFTVLERAADLGGTWRDNHYPGCACDVESHLYSFSFEPNPHWSRAFAPQQEIHAYLRRCADKYGVRSHVRLGEGVAHARYDASRAAWIVQTTAGRQYRARVLISAMGALSNPAYPDIPGLERFEGVRFHSADWNHDYELSGKRVAVIGTGASAIQFVPQIAPRVARLDVYQRTPPWIVPKPDHRIGRLRRMLFEHLPFAQKLVRAATYARLETRVLGFALNPKWMRAGEREALAHLARQIPDPELRRKLTPDYSFGCKRVLLSDDYYPALMRDNVELITDPIAELRKGSVVTQGGQERAVDAVIYGTGFRVKQMAPPGIFFGRDGTDLADAWKRRPEAYKGTAVAGFPNLFLILGPNTGLGHSSMIYMIESQVAYVMDALKQMRERNWSSLEVTQDAQRRYNRRLQSRHQGTVWESGCASWYLDDNGRNIALWPDFTFRFRKLTRRFDPTRFHVARAQADRKPDPRVRPPLDRAATARQRVH